MKPLLALDVDGVLNPYATATKPTTWSDYDRHMTNGYLVWLSAELGKALLELDVEIVWATTWNDLANRCIGPLVGFPKLPVLHYDWQNLPWDDRGCGKLPCVSAAAGQHRPLVWIDDDHGQHDFAWADERIGPTLLITPSPALGLTPAHIAEIKEFLSVFV